MKKGPSLLLVEDSEDDAFFFRRTLQKVCSDCQLNHLPNGAVAIEFLKETFGSDGAGQTLDLIFLDLKMPVLSGFDVLRWVQRQALSPLPRIIVLSGSDHAEDKKRALELGAFQYLVKPIRPQKLTECLDSLRGGLPEQSARMEASS